ncbi:hypothetical protein PoB_001036700 [Plakobranchus ocellatus]|uniref:Uncharacterized protein n=1 Tax=Plakobranchus ocellatus TaxID=259542 RepID=A0AAV3YN60_9GAST|nr:hypothetical protein PoB_001036700 [Plakobranchus ocellatus]
MEATKRQRIFLLLALWAVVASTVLISINEKFPTMLSVGYKGRENSNVTQWMKRDTETKSKLSMTMSYNSSKAPAEKKKSSKTGKHPSESTSHLNYRSNSQSAPVTASSFRRRFLLWDHANTTIESSIGRDHVSTLERYLIYRCDGASMTLCGGWADRVKGILLTYVIANLTGRIFKVEILEPPCNILQYVIPNLVNWTLPVSLHDRIGKSSRDAKAINKVDSVPFYNSIHSLNFTEMLVARNAKYTYFKANLDYSEGLLKSEVYSHQLSWMSSLNNAEILSTLYKRIFKLSSYLQNRMNKFMTSTLPTQRHRLICAHARMGANPTNPYDSAVRLRETDLALTNLLHCACAPKGKIKGKSRNACRSA